jgi:hypothetical protein
MSEDMTPFELASEDIQRGFAEAFEPLSDGDDGPFLPPKSLRDIDAITNGAHTAVAWEYRCRHVDWFNGAPPTGNEVTLRGTTIVDTSGDEATYRRYIDWLDLYVQLGFTMYHRQMVDVVNFDALNNPKVPSGEPSG